MDTAEKLFMDWVRFCILTDSTTKLDGLTFSSLSNGSWRPISPRKPPKRTEVPYACPLCEKACVSLLDTHQAFTMHCFVVQARRLLLFRKEVQYGQGRERQVYAIYTTHSIRDSSCFGHVFRFYLFLLTGKAFDETA